MSVAAFPARLHAMLIDLESCGHSDIASFLPDGRGFRIHNRDDFVLAILPRWFKQRHFVSFQRQLYCYGFERRNVGLEKYSYDHVLFWRDRPTQALQIQRIAARESHPRIHHEVVNLNLCASAINTSGRNTAVTQATDRFVSNAPCFSHALGPHDFDSCAFSSMPSLTQFSGSDSLRIEGDPQPTLTAMQPAEDNLTQGGEQYHTPFFDANDSEP